MNTKNILIILQVGFIFLLVSCNIGANQEILGASSSAFETWAQSNGMPYREPSFTISDNDGTFASVDISAEFKPNADAPWQKHTTTIECRNVGNQWQCDTFMIFPPVQETIVEQPTATAIAVSESLQRTPGSIAFVLYNQPSKLHQLYVSQPDGTDVIKLWESENSLVALGWSPTADKVLFSERIHTDGSYSNILYVVGSDGNALTQLLQLGEDEGYINKGQLLWTNTGQEVYSVLGFNNDADSTFKTIAISIDGSGYTYLMDNEVSGSEVTLSPDKNKMVFYQNNILYIANIDGSGKRALTEQDLGEYIPWDENPFIQSGPDWSHDGAKIAFTFVSHQTSKFVPLIIDVVSEEVTVLEHADPETIGLDGWSPDDSVLLGHILNRDSEKSGFFTIAPNSKRTILKEGYGYLPWIGTECAFSPDGQKILAAISESALSDRLVYIMDLENKSIEEFNPKIPGVEYNPLNINEAYICWSSQ